MAGTLTITTLSDGTNSTSATNCIQGSAKAWVNFVGTSGTRNASYNVSSVTRNTTGDYTINFTTAMPNTNYAVAQTSGSYGVGNSLLGLYEVSRTTSLIRMYCTNTTGTGVDGVSQSVAIFSS